MPGKYKLKTRKAALKRFRKVTAKGNILRGQQCHGHFLSRRGQKARHLTGTTLVDSANFEVIAKMLPGLPAKRRRTKALKNAQAKLSAVKNAVVAAAKKSTAKAAPKAAAK